jgi:hypothetical protein
MFVGFCGLKFHCLIILVILEKNEVFIPFSYVIVCIGHDYLEIFDKKETLEYNEEFLFGSGIGAKTRKMTSDEGFAPDSSREQR